MKTGTIIIILSLITALAQEPLLQGFSRGAVQYPIHTYQPICGLSATLFEGLHPRITMQSGEITIQTDGGVRYSMSDGRLAVQGERIVPETLKADGVDEGTFRRRLVLMAGILTVGEVMEEQARFVYVVASGLADLLAGVGVKDEALLWKIATDEEIARELTEQGLTFETICRWPIAIARGRSVVGNPRNWLRGMSLDRATPPLLRRVLGIPEVVERLSDTGIAHAVESLIDTSGITGAILAALRRDDLVALSYGKGLTKRQQAIRAVLAEKGLTYEQATELIGSRRDDRKGRIIDGIWSNQTTTQNMILAALDGIPGFRAARLRTGKEGGPDIALMAALYHKHVIGYRDPAGKVNGQKGYFIAQGLGTLLSHTYDYMNNRISPAAYVRLVLPALIDRENPDALQPQDVEHDYWQYRENAEYHILKVLDAIPGFREARDAADIALMAMLYREYVIGYRDPAGKLNGQNGFFHAQGLSALLQHTHDYMGKTGSPAGLVRLVLPALIDPANPAALQPREVERDSAQRRAKRAAKGYGERKAGGAPAGDQRANEQSYEHLRETVRSLDDDGCVVDIGSGDPSFIVFTRKVKPSIRVIAISDTDESMGSLQSGLKKGSLRTMKFLVIDAVQLTNVSVSNVIANMMRRADKTQAPEVDFVHWAVDYETITVKSLEGVIGELHTTLKPGGLVCIDMDAEGEMEELLKTLLSEAGFTDMTVIGIPSTINKEQMALLARKPGGEAAGDRHSGEAVAEQPEIIESLLASG